MLVFQGHIVWPGGLGGDFVLSLLPIIFFMVLRKFTLLPNIGKTMKFCDYLLAFVNIIFIPNSVYAIFEIKHLFRIDNIADNPNLWSYLIFGGICIVGIISSVVIARLIVRFYAKNKLEIFIYSFFLGMINGLGAAVGLVLNLNSWDILLAIIKIISTNFIFLNSTPFLQIFILTTIIFFVFYQVIDIVIPKPPL